MIHDKRPLARSMGGRRLPLLLFAALSTAAGACDAEGECGPERAEVARVLDGDTIELSSGEKIRYLLIDAPEVSSPAECFAAEARELNSELVAGRMVGLRYGEVCEDRFGRTLAYVSVGERDIGALLVERGYACVLYIPPGGAERVDEYRALERRAELGGRGLWGLCEENPCRS